MIIPTWGRAAECESKGMKIPSLKTKIEQKMKKWKKKYLNDEDFFHGT